MIRIAIVALFLAANLFSAQQPSAKAKTVPGAMQTDDGVVMVPAKEMQAAAAKPGTRVFDKGMYSAMFFQRTGPGQAELHDSESDIFYIVEGTATFVTGGTIVEPKSTEPGETRGKGIKGGHTWQLKAGDCITIPKKVPHWYSSVNPPFRYFIVKIHE